MKKERRNALKSYEVKVYWLERVESSMLVEAKSEEDARAIATTQFDQIIEDYCIDSLREISKDERAQLENSRGGRLN